MGCSCSSTAADYLACARVPIAPPLVDDNVLMNIAAQAGARSSDWTMCLVVALLKARRMVYWKSAPGDCGSNNFYFTPTTQYEAQAAAALGTLAAADPEPISKAVLGGIDTIFGGFLAAHAKAVQREETTICQVSITYNQGITGLEKAVALGQVSASDAAAFLDSKIGELDQTLAAIYKACNAACGYRMGLRALNAFNADYVFPALAPIIPAFAPITAPINNAINPPPPASAATPGGGAPLSAGPLTSGVPTMTPTSISLPGGQGGLILVGGGLIAARIAGVL